jgi:hypothetical protein
VDLVFTSQNYHDYHDKFMGPADLGVFGKQVLTALKPGGVFVVIDHTARAGSGIEDADTLHRIDPEVVKKEMTAAGFVFDGPAMRCTTRRTRSPQKCRTRRSAVRRTSSCFVSASRRNRPLADTWAWDRGSGSLSTRRGHRRAIGMLLRQQELQARAHGRAVGSFAFAASFAFALTILSAQPAGAAVPDAIFADGYEALRLPD